MRYGSASSAEPSVTHCSGAVGLGGGLDGLLAPLGVDLRRRRFGLCRGLLLWFSDRRFGLFGVLRRRDLLLLRRRIHVVHQPGIAQQNTESENQKYYEAAFHK